MCSTRFKLVALAVAAILLSATLQVANGFSSRSTRLARTRTACSMNFFDDIKLIFSKEGQNNIKAYNDQQKEEQLKAQQEILARRRDPKKMQQYEAEKEMNRKALAEERAVYSFQQKSEEGYDPLTDWKRLKDEGKIKIGKDLKRDDSTSRLGSEGLIDVRVDERMPYIDQGYVDEDADAMGKFMKLFGKKNNKQ